MYKTGGQKAERYKQENIKGVFFITWDDCKLIKPILIVVMCSDKFENFYAPYKGICIKNSLVINFNMLSRFINKMDIIESSTAGPQIMSFHSTFQC